MWNHIHITYLWPDCHIRRWSYRQYGCQARYYNSRSCINILSIKPLNFFQEDLETFSSCVCSDEEQIMWLRRQIWKCSYGEVFKGSEKLCILLLNLEDLRNIAAKGLKYAKSKERKNNEEIIQMWSLKHFDVKELQAEPHYLNLHHLLASLLVKSTHQPSCLFKV